MIAGVAGMSILVTGGSGVMGSRLVRLLASRGARVRVLVVPCDPFVSRLEGISCERYEGDLDDGAALARACAGVQMVYHLAAVILARDTAVLDRVNRVGTANLVGAAAAAGVRHFVYVSSASVIYPKLTPYGASKLAAEDIVKAQRAFEHTIVRPTLVYDEHGGQEFRMFAQSLHRFAVVLFVGSGSARKRPVFAGDVVDGLARIAGNRRAFGNIYNFSGAERISLVDMARLILELEGTRKPFVHVPLPLCRLAAKVMGRVLRDPPLTPYIIAGMTNDADLSPAEAMSDLGYAPIGAREGFRRCLSQTAQGNLGGTT